MADGLPSCQIPRSRTPTYASRDRGMPANDERLLGPERSKSEQAQTLIKLSYILPLPAAANITSPRPPRPAKAIDLRRPPSYRM